MHLLTYRVYVYDVQNDVQKYLELIECPNVKSSCHKIIQTTIIARVLGVQRGLALDN